MTPDLMQGPKPVGHSSRVRAGIFALLLLGGTLLTLACLGEVVCRVAGYGREVRYTYVPELGWAHEPSQRARTVGKPVHINALGLRGPELSAEKSRGVRRLLMLGDSFTFGYGVDDDSTYSRQLERLFAAPDLACGEIQVLNGGINGYNTGQEIAFLRHTGLALKPDIVVLAFTPNDIMEADEAKLILRWPRLKEALARSALYQFLAPRVKGLIFRRAALAYEDVLARFIAGDPSVSPRLHAIVDDLGQFRRLSVVYKFQPIIMFFPFATQVTAKKSATWPPSLLSSAAANDTVPVVDLLPALQSASQRGESLFQAEPTHHPNGQGQGIAAAELLAALRRKRVLARCTEGALAPSQETLRPSQRLQ